MADISDSVKFYAGTTSVTMGRRQSAASRMRASPLAFILPPLIVLVVIVVIPSIHLFINSLYRWSLLSGVKRFDGIGQYRAVLTDALFLGSLVRTFIYTIVVVGVEIVLGLLFALLFNHKFAGDRVVRTIYLTPMLMVPIVVGLLWSLMYQPSIGVLNFILGQFGVEPLGWLSSSVLALPSIGIAEVWQWTPFVAIVFVAALQGLAPNVIAAARLDGAGRLRRLLTIELPMMTNVVGVIFLLRFIDVFKTFGLVYIMTRGGPGSSTVLAGFYPWEVGFSELLMGKASAAAFILMNIISVLALILIRAFLRETDPI